MSLHLSESRSVPPQWMVSVIADAIRSAVGGPEYVARIAAEDLMSHWRFQAAFAKAPGPAEPPTREELFGDG